MSIFAHPRRFRSKTSKWSASNESRIAATNSPTSTLTSGRSDMLKSRSLSMSMSEWCPTPHRRFSLLAYLIASSVLWFVIVRQMQTISSGSYVLDSTFRSSQIRSNKIFERNSSESITETILPLIILRNHDVTNPVYVATICSAN